jgi:hypothetical protein
LTESAGRQLLYQLPHPRRDGRIVKVWS